MYSTCIFCNGSLGANEAIEAFPVGRRLAFDAAKGRLWVVCRSCERWNLTPLEERWEAIEQCERAFRDTKLRVSTDEIGLARLRDGLELVRIGSPMRPEMAAWRYGDQFGRRRRRALIVGGAAATAVGAFVVAGPVMGAIPIGIFGGHQIFNIAHGIYYKRLVAARIPRATGAPLLISREELGRAAVRWNALAQRWSLEVHHLPTDHSDSSRWKFARKHATSAFEGDEALHAARHLLPHINAGGARQRTVNEAVQFLSETPEVDSIFARAVRAAPLLTTKTSRVDASVQLAALAAPVRLGLEMATHEESERRALEGELHLLEAAWRDAEEIAAIADDMFLPASVDEQLARLKRER